MTTQEQEIRERLIHKLTEIDMCEAMIVKKAEVLFNWIVANDHTQPKDADKKG